MRARSRPDPRVVDAARRRLEALVAELDGLPAAVGALGHQDERRDDPDREVDLADSDAEHAGRCGTRDQDETDREALGTGRHARRPVPTSRRATSWAGDRLPAPLVGLRLGGRHLAVVAVLLVAGLLLAGWSYLRTTGGGDAIEVAAPLASGGVGVEGSGERTLGSDGASGGPPGAAAASPSSGPVADHAPSQPGGVGSSDGAASSYGGGADSGEQVVVDVEGKVRRPGIAVLPSGSRVVDALQAVGGARPGADLATLNLARLLVDGEQLLVDVAPARGVAAGVLAGPPAASPPAGSGAVGAPAALVNLNTADQVALETLPGVGPVTAAAILQWRTEHGAFSSVDELLEVSGIGDVTLAEIAPHVTL